MRVVVLRGHVMGRADYNLLMLEPELDERFIVGCGYEVVDAVAQLWSEIST
jgi:hypothetical protein